MHPQNKDGAVMTLMFRVLTHTVLVDRNTRRLVNPEPHPDQAEFDAIRDTWQNEQEVVDAKATLLEKVRQYCNATND